MQAEQAEMAAEAGAGTDRAELAKFEAVAARWWDLDGPFAPLHAITPCRCDYALGQIAASHGIDLARRAPLDGLTLLDIGCGGGLFAEPMARLGAAVVGLDPGAEAIAAARAHAAGEGLAIDYRIGRAEDLAAESARFDVVAALEVVEHVPDPARFVATAGSLVAPGGLLLLSTLNRTAQSFALAIVGAEYVLGWLPRGTHDWRRFIEPDRLGAMVAAAGLCEVDRAGLVFRPLAGDWRISPGDLSVNYAMAAERPIS